MSLPGFGGPSNDDEIKSKLKISIPEGHEWRIEVPFKSFLKLTVTSGVGEVFGTELPVNTEVQFCGVKYAVYAPVGYGGATLEYSISPNRDNMTNEAEDIVEYISEETVMESYLNLHFILESIRIEEGPRVLILGGPNSGKTSLSKILSLYAVKMNSTPILVNLNPRDGVFALPGSLTATTISDSFDLESCQGYGSSTTSGTLYHNPKQPIVKNFGFTDHKLNLDLYKYQVSKLGITVMSRLAEDSNAGKAGVLIDTPALNIKDINIIENIVSDFEVNFIVVIGNERLLLDLKKKFKHKENLNILKVPKSEGCVEVDESFFRRSQEETIKEYFNGNHKTVLSPFKTDLNVGDFKIFKGVEQLELGYSFLPAGDSYEATEKEDLLDKYFTLLTEPSPSNLDNSILAVTHLELRNLTNRELLSTSILGYVHVNKFDETRGKLKVLLPSPGTFPKNVLILTGVGYSE